MLFFTKYFKHKRRFRRLFQWQFTWFCRNCCTGCSDFDEIKDLISDVKIENSRNGSKIPKFTLQIYAFVYQRLIDFPQGRFDYETLTTINFFKSAHRTIDVKIHLHHLHVTGKIIGYAHDFCSIKVKESQSQFSCIAHKLFRFDMFFLIKGIRLSVCETKDVNISGTVLKSINFANICTQVKFRYDEVLFN